jgi:D-sedoheptulose 7-phosphate isomerase
MMQRDAVIRQPHERPPLLTVPTQPRARAIAAAIRERQGCLAAALGQFAHRAPILADVAVSLIHALQEGRQALVAGNGGSAAEAQHLVAELVGRFRRERRPYAVVALTADSAILTAVANDYGYEEVFARQVRALGRPGDILLLFSTSGESENLVRAALAGREGGLTTVAITGDRPSRLASLVDHAVQVPATETALVQELHQVVTHLLCDVVEGELAAAELATPLPASEVTATWTTEVANG